MGLRCCDGKCAKHMKNISTRASITFSKKVNDYNKDVKLESGIHFVKYFIRNVAVHGSETWCMNWKVLNVEFNDISDKATEETWKGTKMRMFATDLTKNEHWKEKKYVI